MLFSLNELFLCPLHLYNCRRLRRTCYMYFSKQLVFQDTKSEHLQISVHFKLRQKLFCVPHLLGLLTLINNSNILY